MIKHIVFWKVAPLEDREQRKKVCDTFREKTANLKKIIPQIREAAVGCNYNDDGFHICIDSVFDSKEGLQQYIDHPEHLKVREWLNSVTCDKTVFDYEY